MEIGISEGVFYSGEIQTDYIYLVVRNSIDGKVLKALRDKQNLAKMLVDDYRAGRQPFK